MSRFSALEIIYAKFPYAGIETKEAHPVLILKTMSDSNGNEYAVVSAGTCAVDKKTLELKHPKRSHEILISGDDLLDEAGLSFPTFFKFNPIITEDGKMKDGSVMTISLDDRFLAKSPQKNKTLLGKISLDDTRIKNQFVELSKSINLEKIISNEVDRFCAFGIQQLQSKEEEYSKDLVNQKVSTIRKKNNFKLPKSFIKKPWQNYFNEYIVQCNNYRRNIMQNLFNNIKVDEMKDNAKKVCDQMASIADKGFEKVERLAALNLGVAHDYVESTLNSSKELLSAKSPSEFGAMLKENVTQNYHKSVSYFKDLANITKWTPHE